MVKAIVGANWGDEGKGKITDLMAEASDIVVRFQGGANAGHTIINDYGRFALHTLPSGVFYAHITNVIGNGVALDMQKITSELRHLAEAGVPTPNLMISDRAQLLLPYHILQDTYEEERLGGHAFGSTKSGIAPFYSDKYAKIGIQVCDLFDPPRLREHVERAVEVKNILFQTLYHKPPINAEALFRELLELREIISPYVGDTVTYLHQALQNGKSILLEGQLGAMKDPDLGMVPMTTSSHTLAGFGCVGAPVPPTAIHDVICVTKAYSSCVGAQTEPFVSELLGEAGAELRRRGGDQGEFGATTGRPRRVGPIDLGATRYGVEVQGATNIALTKLDILSYMDKIPVCAHYELDGQQTDEFPFPVCLQDAKPVIEYVDGWKCDISKVRSWDELPENARNYVEYVERAIGCHIGYVSVGAERDSLIIR